RLGEPKRAGQERALRAGEAIVSEVAVHEGSDGELTPYCVDRANEPIGRPAVAEENSEKETGIDAFRTGGADVAVFRRRPAPLFDEGTYRVGFVPPPRCSLRRYVSAAGQLTGPIERYPAHHLRLREVRRLAAHFPDPCVRLAPRTTHEVCDADQAASDVAVDPSPPRRVHRHGVHEVAVDVELKLIDCSVPDSNWR